MTDVRLSMPRAAATCAFELLALNAGERCLRARGAWLNAVPRELPTLARAAVRTAVPQPWGDHELSVPEAQALVALAVALGGWRAAFAAWEG